MISTTQNIIKKVYRDLSTFKIESKDIFSEIAYSEVNKIFLKQKETSSIPSHDAYEKAGFKAQTLTSMIVQSQIAQLY